MHDEEDEEAFNGKVSSTSPHRGIEKITVPASHKSYSHIFQSISVALNVHCKGFQPITE